MEKWRQKIGLVLASLSLLCLTPKEIGAQYCGPCDWSVGGFGNGLQINLDFLWWKPCVDQLDYAAQETFKDGVSTYKYKSICPDWEPGFRVAFGAPEIYNEWGIWFSYTTIDASTSEKVKGDLDISSPLIHPGIDGPTLLDEVKAKFSLSYNEWDILISYNASCDECYEYRPFLGVACVSFDQKLTATFDENEGKVKWKSDYSGIGLRVGGLYHYTVSDCIRLFAIANGTILIGDGKGKYRQELDDTLILKDDKCCHIIPGCHIGAGFFYEITICEFPITCRLGYEFLQWRNVHNHRVLPGDNDTNKIAHSTSNSTRTLGFQGILAGISLNF